MSKLVRDLEQYKRRAMDETRRRRQAEEQIRALEARIERLERNVAKLKLLYRQLEDRYNGFRKRMMHSKIDRHGLAFLNWLGRDT